MTSISIKIQVKDRMDQFSNRGYQIVKADRVGKEDGKHMFEEELVNKHIAICYSCTTTG